MYAAVNTRGYVALLKNRILGVGYLICQPNEPCFGRMLLEISPRITEHVGKMPQISSIFTGKDASSIEDYSFMQTPRYSIILHNISYLLRADFVRVGPFHIVDPAPRSIISRL